MALASCFWTVCRSALFRHGPWCPRERPRPGGGGGRQAGRHSQNQQQTWMQQPPCYCAAAVAMDLELVALTNAWLWQVLAEG